jgi:apolipoprotein N-acyltransferase
VNRESARLPLLFLAGIALSFAFPAADLSPLAWVGLVPLIYALRGQTMGRGFLFGTLFGLGFFGALLIWISLVGWVAWAILVVVQTLFVSFFGLLYARITNTIPRLWTVVAAPVLWTALEFARALVPVGGFTWGQLAQSQHNLNWMLRPASIGGGWLVTFLLIAVNALIAYAIEGLRTKEPRHTAPALAGAVVLLAAPLALPSNDATGSPIRVAIVQGNVPRNWQGSFFERDLLIVRNHVQLTKQLDTNGIDFVVWPESSVGIDPEATPEVGALLAEAARSAGVPLIVGGNTDAGEDHYKVMAFEISPAGSIVDRYQKTHLVPFGEYVPGRKLLGWIPLLDQIPRDAIPASEPTLFEVAGGLVAPVLSYEGDFGSLVRRRIDVGGRLLLVITNTSTWGDSWASAQHLAFSQLRAAENGVWVVHAAISGISAFVAPDGTALKATDLWTRATLVQDLRFAEDASFYARTGDWLPIACTVGSVILLVVSLLRSRRPEGAGE